MADISKCIGTDCKLKEYCYRFTAPANELWQSYSPHHKADLNTEDNGNQFCTAFDNKKYRNGYYCNECKGVTFSTVCENPSCPYQPCCGEITCKCKS